MKVPRTCSKLFMLILIAGVFCALYVSVFLNSDRGRVSLEKDGFNMSEQFQSVKVKDDADNDKDYEDAVDEDDMNEVDRNFQDTNDLEKSSVHQQTSSEAGGKLQDNMEASRVDGHDIMDTSPVDGQDIMDTSPVDGQDIMDTSPVDGQDIMDTSPVDGDDSMDTSPVDGQDNLDASPVDGQDNMDALPVDDQESRKTTSPIDGQDNMDTSPVDGQESVATSPVPGQDGPVRTKEVSPTKIERVMKILDFNHRRGYPLNYSFKHCQYSACEFTNVSDQADLVLINGARLKALTLPPRTPGQIWLMYTKEPPTFKRFRSLNRADFHDQVNWTRCIFRDSTFRGHYGWLVSRTPPDRNYEEIYARKKFQVAWFVSNCNSPSRRNEYVRRISSQVDVHIYGDCGDRKCGGHGLRLGLLGNKDHCLEMVSRDYKFYISFENSMCSDYVTEKFFKTFENIDVIPVVRGGANYSELAPKGTYIDSRDFRSPEELGRYLDRLSKNKQEYIRMLRLKDGYTNTSPQPPFPCELCKALHTRRHVPSTYPSILGWMLNHCWEPNDL